VYNMMLLMMISTLHNYFKSRKQCDTNSSPNAKITIDAMSTASRDNVQISNSTTDHAAILDHSILPPSVSPVMMSFRNVFCDVQSCWILLMMLVLRPHNIILVMLVVWQEYLVRCIMRRYNILNITQMTLLYYWMGQVAFFYQVHRNIVGI
jgi:hypothetical protein